MTAPETIGTLPRGRMRRLSAVFYRGYAAVHWSMAVDGRAQGWLDADTHARLREVMLHALARQRLICPAYCLMPDHLHALWLGLAPDSDQGLAAAHFRRYANAALAARSVRLQKQAWDVVLRSHDRERGAVTRAAWYIAENPVRAALTQTSGAWPWSGAVAVGYPEFDWRDPAFTEMFWRIYEREVKRWRV